MMPERTTSSLPWSTRPSDDFTSPSTRSRTRPTQRSRPSASSIFQAPSREAASESWRRPVAPSSIGYSSQSFDSRMDADRYAPHHDTDLLIRSASDHHYDSNNPTHIQVKLPTQAHFTPGHSKDTLNATPGHSIIPKDPSLMSHTSLHHHEHVYEPETFAFSPFSPLQHSLRLPDNRYIHPGRMGHTASRFANEIGGFINRGKDDTGELPPARDSAHKYPNPPFAPQPSDPIPIPSANAPDDDLTPTPSVKPPTRDTSTEWRRPLSPVYQPLQPSPRYITPQDAYAYRHGPLDISEDRCGQSRFGAPPTPPFGTSKTEPFSLDPPPYTDADIPLPEPYNKAYPHPLSAYASLGVNEETRRRSGYDKALWELWNSNPDKLRGTILSEAGRDDLIPPALTMLIFPGEGNGIPERLWSRFESFGAARVPVGVAGIPANSALPPRLASLNHSNSMTSITSTISAYGSLSAHPSLTGPMSKSAMTPEDVPSRQDDYFSVPRQVRHSTSMINLGTGYGSMPPTPQQEYSVPSQPREGWNPRIDRVVPPLTPPPEPRGFQPPNLPARAYPSPPQGSRQSIRRASASPMDLQTVAEQHEPSSPDPSRPIQTSPEVAPIGSERITHRSLSQRNGRSPDLATMAEYFASRPKPAANLSLGGMGIVELGQRYAQQTFVPRYAHPSYIQGREPWLHVDTAPKHGDLTPKASSSSLSSMAEAPAPVHPPLSARHSVSTSMSSSQNLPTPLSGSTWGIEVQRRDSPTTSLSGSVLNSGSFGSAYGKRLASEVSDKSTESTDRESTQGSGSKNAESSTSWDFSTGKSIWC